MLNNIKIYILAFLTISLVSCSNDDIDPLFDTDVNTRVNEQLDSYRKVLLSAENGWKTRYQPGSAVGAYNIYLKFNEDNSVELTSDLLNGVHDLETSYRVGISQFPELVFENYTAFHFLFESNGFSLGAEFEFIFEEATENEIRFRSKTDTGEPSIIIFEKATEADKLTIESLRDLYDRVEDGFNTTSFIRNLVVLNSTSEIIFNSTFTFYETAERRAGISVFDMDTGSLNTTIHPIAITDIGFDLLTPLVVNGTDISVFEFDEANNRYVSNDGGFTTIIEYDLVPVTTGIVPDLFSEDVNDFGKDFKVYSYFDNNSQFHLRQTSQHFLNLGLSSDFFRLDVVFDDANAGGISYFQFSMNDGSFVFATFDDVIITDERFIFNLQGISGDPTNIISVLNILFEPNGFYIQRTNESNFIDNPSYQLTSVAFPNFRFSVYGI